MPAGQGQKQGEHSLGYSSRGDTNYSWMLKNMEVEERECQVFSWFPMNIGTVG